MSKSEEMLVALHSQDLEKAKQIFKEALVKDDEETLRNLAEELKRLGFMAEEKQIYEKLLEATPEDADLHLSLAEIAFEDGEVDQAFIHLDYVKEGDHLYTTALVLQADIYQSLDLTEVSEAKLKEAIKIEPNEPLLRFALAELYYLERKLEDALLLYMRLPSQLVGNRIKVSIYERIGSIYGLQGHFEEAIQFLEKALESKVDYKGVLNRLGFIYLQVNEVERSIKIYQELHLLDPHFPNYDSQYAKALMLANRLDEAQVTIKHGIQKDPYWADNFLIASEIACRQNDKEAAENYLLQAVELASFQDFPLYRLMDFYIKQERFDDVLKMYEKLEDKEEAKALWFAAKAYSGLEQYKLAAECYQAAALDLQENLEFLRDYAYFLRDEGRLQESKEMIQRALALEPGDLEMLSLVAKDDFM